MPLVKRPGQPDLDCALYDYTDPWRNAPYLILQHGLGRSGRFWYSWVPYLARFYKVVRTDMRGLGQSSADWDLDKGFTMDDLIDDLIAVIDDLVRGGVREKSRRRAKGHAAGAQLLQRRALAVAHPGAGAGAVSPRRSHRHG